VGRDRGCGDDRRHGRQRDRLTTPTRPRTRWSSSLNNAETVEKPLTPTLPRNPRWVRRERGIA
jgi:hypothetical protein